MKLKKTETVPVPGSTDLQTKITTFDGAEHDIVKKKRAYTKAQLTSNILHTYMGVSAWDPFIRGKEYSVADDYAENIIDINGKAMNYVPGKTKVSEQKFAQLEQEVVVRDFFVDKMKDADVALQQLICENKNFDLVDYTMNNKIKEKKQEEIAVSDDDQVNERDRTREKKIKEDRNDKNENKNKAKRSKKEVVHKISSNEKEEEQQTDKKKSESYTILAGTYQYAGVSVPYKIDVEPSKWSRFVDARKKLTANKIESHENVTEADSLKGCLEKNPLMYNIRFGEDNPSTAALQKKYATMKNNDMYLRGLNGECLSEKEKISLEFIEAHKDGVIARMVGIHGDSFRSNNSGSINHNLNVIRKAMSMKEEDTYYMFDDPTSQTGAFTGQQHGAGKQLQHQKAIDLFASGMTYDSYGGELIANTTVKKIIRMTSAINEDSDSEYRLTSSELKTNNNKGWEKIDIMNGEVNRIKQMINNLSENEQDILLEQLMAKKKEREKEK